MSTGNTRCFFQWTHFILWNAYGGLQKWLTEEPKTTELSWEREGDIGCFRLNAVKSQAALRVEVIREDLELRVQDFHSRICEDNRKRTSEYFYGSSCFDISTLLITLHITLSPSRVLTVLNKLYTGCLNAHWEKRRTGDRKSVKDDTHKGRKRCSAFSQSPFGEK